MSTVNASGAITSASHSVQPGRPAAVACAATPNTSSATRAPRATPNASPRKRTIAPVSRAVPETRCCEFSSAMAADSVSPGNSTISPPSVAR